METSVSQCMGAGHSRHYTYSCWVIKRFKKSQERSPNSQDIRKTIWRPENILIFQILESHLNIHPGIWYKGCFMRTSRIIFMIVCWFLFFHSLKTHHYLNATCVWYAPIVCIKGSNFHVPCLHCRVFLVYCWTGTTSCQYQNCQFGEYNLGWKDLEQLLPPHPLLLIHNFPMSVT